MSKNIKEIKELFRDISGYGAYEIMDGVVSKVDESSFMINVEINEGVTLYDVKLRTVSNNSQSGIICIPKIGSYVLVAKLRNTNNYVMIQSSELDKVIIDTDVKIELNTEKTVFNEGLKGGLVQIEELKTNLDQIKTYVTTMKGALSAALTTIDGVTGAGSTVPFNTTMGTVAINYVNMENEDIKQ